MMPDLQKETLEDFGLGGIDCKECGNTGQLIEKGKEPLEIHVTECPCMKRRRSLRSLRKAGMEDMALRYTLDNYSTPDQKHKSIKETAKRFIDSDEGWFYIAGQPGSGKTHICTAICTSLMERNSEIVFMPWRDESTALKTGITDREWYESRIKPLKEAPVLYIDDFLKGGITEADIRLAFEILNARYNKATLRTVISSEITLDKILKADEATGSRIYERCRGFNVIAPDENWRLK